jgi:hypothetical protein
MTVLTSFDSNTTGPNALDTLNDALVRLAGVTTANLTFGTTMTTGGVFSDTNYGKLTRVTGSGATITFPSATGLADGTLIDLWFTGGAGTANGVAVQAGGRILFAAVGNSWVHMKPFNDLVGSGDGGSETAGYRCIWINSTGNVGNGTYAGDNFAVLSVSEVILKDGATVIPNGSGTASASNVNGTDTAAKAYDANTATWWSTQQHAAAGSPGRFWLGYDYGAGVRKAPTSIDFVVRSDLPSWGFEHGAIYGTNNPANIGNIAASVLMAEVEPDFPYADLSYTAGNNYTRNIAVSTALDGGSES